MPIHDWARVDVGIFHDFHRGWTTDISRALNRGVLPDGYFAMMERREGFPGSTEAELYARKADRIAIKQGLGRVVAMIEIVSPGNRDSRHAVGSFVSKAVEFLRNGIHFLMIDPFPSGPRDPQGLSQLIWDELVGEPLPPRPEGRPLGVTAFDAGDPLTAYVEHLAVGDAWPEAPLFLEPGWYVNVPLEETYGTSWSVTPRPIRELVEPGA